MNKKLLFLLFSFFLTFFPLAAQHTISLSVNIDEEKIQNFQKRLLIKIKCKNQDTIYVAPYGQKVFMPWLYNPIEFFELKLDEYRISKSGYAAELEKKGLFSEKNNNWMISIDNYPFSSLTKLKFSNLSDDEYLFIIKTGDSDLSVIASKSQFPKKR